MMALRRTKSKAVLGRYHRIRADGRALPAKTKANA
jgi:hypothetical protein